ncbi:MAG TPA: hypothetical protein VI893_04375 [Thermoplasmata archaeon]|nr:hypothetical protein [Thermoplasmata archaeon]
MSDTSRIAAELQATIHRRLTGSERLGIALDMSLTVRQLSLSRLRLQHPDWSERDLERELLRYAFLPAALPLPPL